MTEEKHTLDHTILFDEVVKFHGHRCPGLSLGYRVALVALREFAAERAEDEELVAIVENNSCSVDAIQYVVGCTVGKGNLIFRDYGKHGYTFYHWKSGRGIRIYADYFIIDSDDDTRYVELREKISQGEATEADREELRNLTKMRCQRILNAPEEQFIRIGPAREPMPQRAVSYRSIVCAFCGEKVMEPRSLICDGKICCIPCSCEATV